METSKVSRTTAFELAVGFCGLLVSVLYVPYLHIENWITAVLLVAFATLLESIPVPIGKAFGSLMIAVPIGVMVVDGGAEAVCLSASAMALSLIIRRGSLKVSTLLFNVGQNALSTSMMVEVYRLAHDSLTYSLLDWHVVVGVLCGVAAYFVANHAFIHLLQVFRGRFDTNDIVQMFVEDGINILVALPLAFLMILLGNRQPLLGPIIMLPISLLGQVIRLYRQAGAVQHVHRVTAQLTSEFDVQKLCAVATHTASQLTYADCVAIFLLDEQTQALTPTVFFPADASRHFVSDGLLEKDGGVIWNAIRTGNWTYVPDTKKDSRVVFRRVSNLVHRSMAVFPMVTRGMIHGALVCYGEHPYAFGTSLENVQTLSSQVAVLLENAKLYQTLQEQSVRDGATGLYNYRYFYEALDRNMGAAQASMQPLSVTVIDVDYFKKFNDTYGHLAGDHVLKSVGQLLAMMAGPDTVVARYGGEEFGIIFGCDRREAYERVEAMRLAVGKLMVEFEGYHLQGITISSGIASFPDDAVDGRDLLVKADSAMYWGAKQRGRNRTAEYSPDFDAQLFIDEVTGLYTYHFINIKTREELQAGQRVWGVICLDIHNFGYVNSTFGFDVGDRVLKETSLIIKESLRQNELACRFGGDDFLILIPDVDKLDLSTIAQRVEESIESHRFRGAPNVILSLHPNVVAERFTKVKDAADLFDRVSRLMSGIQSSLARAQS